jgi:spore germination protein GerM
VRRARSIAWALALALVVATSACAVGPDDSPRDIDRDVLDQIRLVPSGGGAAAAGTGRVYLLAPTTAGTPTQLQAVARDVEADPLALLQALLAGPNDDEIANQLRTALPPGLTLNEVRRRAAGVLLVDVSDEITNLSGDTLIAAVAQIVFTATALTVVRAVELTVEGATTQWPAGNGELTAEPLTVYDYPGIEPSTQPAYPGLPA